MGSESPYPSRTDCDLKICLLMLSLVALGMNFEIDEWQLVPKKQLVDR